MQRLHKALHLFLLFRGSGGVEKMAVDQFGPLVHEIAIACERQCVDGVHAEPVHGFFQRLDATFSVAVRANCSDVFATNARTSCPTTHAVAFDHLAKPSLPILSDADAVAQVMQPPHFAVAIKFADPRRGAARLQCAGTADRRVQPVTLIASAEADNFFKKPGL